MGVNGDTKGESERGLRELMLGVKRKGKEGFVKYGERSRNAKNACREKKAL